MNAQSAPGILVDLDVLQETRLATIARLDQLAAARVLHASFHTRESDWFEGVDMEAYAKLWRERDLETLARSAPTEGYNLVRELVKYVLQESVQMNSPYSGSFRVAVNTYPYHASDAVMADIGKAVAIRLGVPVPVEMVSYSPAELTPSVVRSQFRMLVMYDYDTWLSAQYNYDPSKDSVKGFVKKLLLDVTLFAPQIYYGKPPSKEELQRAIDEVGHPIATLEKIASALVGLQLIDVAHFSIVRPAQGHTPPNQAPHPEGQVA